MINRQTLLSDLQKLLQRLEADLLERSESAEVPDVEKTLRAEYERAKTAERTAQNYEDWRRDAITQAAAAWVLSCVFVRFLEDNRLIDPPKVSGPTGRSGQQSAVSGQQSAVGGQQDLLTADKLNAESSSRLTADKLNAESSSRLTADKLNAESSRLQRARDEHELYFREHLKQSDRDYLLAVFDQLATLPGTKDVFGEHNPIRELPNWLSGDAAGELLRFFQKIDANTGVLVHDFTDSNWDTRFLGDLYQDLSEAARKKYALLQTPEFVEEFILDRTLNPALDEFGLEAHAKAQRREEERTSISSSLSAFAPLRESLFKMIDPACGSGHFLLGSFRRILDRWEKQEPGTNVRELVQRTLDSIYGVDVNPFAIAIARFRLLLAAMRACGIERLADAPAFRMNLVCGDSLYHGRQRQQTLAADWTDEAHYFAAEDAAELRKILKEGTYHCVVANRPYITPKDRAANEAYRKLYPRTCHMKYSLAVPFMERLFRLAIRGDLTQRHEDAKEDTQNLSAFAPLRETSSGFVGQITANSFMKREFGKKLIESFFPTVDLTHVIDTSGAYIPGHGTPTVILFGRHRPPMASTLRTVMGIRGEPATPDDPAQGLVWSAIVALIDRPEGLTQRREGAKCGMIGNRLSAFAPLRESSPHDQFVSVADSPREPFHKHPWSIGGGGASELKEQLEEGATQRLEALTQSIGFASFTGTDEAFLLEPRVLERFRVTPTMIRPTILGDNVRDWCVNDDLEALAPYDGTFDSYPYAADAPWGRYLWLFRNTLGSVISFGGRTRLECGDQWWTWYRWVKEKYCTPLSIVFAEVATHNHFVLDRGGKVFNRTAPVIKLPREASEDDHLALLGLLNSSTACFWMKQVCFPKGGDHVGQEGARVRRTAWDERYAFNGTNLERFPLPTGRPQATASMLDRLAQELADSAPAQALTQRRQGAKQELNPSPLSAFAPLRESLSSARQQWELARSQMIAAQEELDWECYRLYGLLSDQQSAVSNQPEKEADSNSLTADKLTADKLTADKLTADKLTADSFPPLQLGQRAFEIVLARQMAAGETETAWFERHGSTPITELPAEWPDDYRQLVERRIELIESDPNIRLIEQPEYKRRWNTEPWDSQLERALRQWLLDRLESYFDFDGRMKESGQPESGQQSAVSGQPEEKKADSCSLIAESSLVSVAKLADVARRDAEFQQVGELFRDDSAFVVQSLVAELVAAESVPLLPVLRYKPSGLIKRGTWERTWDLQREEDKRSAVSDQQSAGEGKPNADKLTTDGYSIPVPTKYDSKDFLDSNFWRLRGKLDVPKERWISFPHCEGPDVTLVICWAGYDHLQQARAISAYYVDIQERLGGRDDPRLIPLLACLLELLPWLKQWHNEVDPEYGMAMGDYFEGFINEEARQLGKTLPEIKAWQPPKKVAGRRRKKGGT